VISAVSSSQWANLRLRIQRIADFEVGHVLDERRGEFVVNVSVNNDAFAGDTRLTIIISARHHCSRSGRLDIRRRHDNKRIRAAQLPNRLLDMVSSYRGDRASRMLSPGQRDGFYSRI